MSSLHDELAARAHAIAASTPADPESAPGMIRTVKRKARAKFATNAGVGLAVVMVGAVGTMMVLDREAALPIAPGSPSPSPTIIPSASPTPEVTVDADGRALPGFVTIAEDLPDALALPAGMLESAQPGWVLGLYRPEVGPSPYSEDTRVVVEAERQVIYLASPEGTRYQVLELPTEPQVVLGQWDAGSSTVLVGVCGETSDEYCSWYDLGRLDLTTGQIDSSAYQGVGPVRLVSTYPGGAALWDAYGSDLVLTDGDETTRFDGAWELWDSMPDDGMSPSGDYVIVNSFDSDTQETTWGVVDLVAKTLSVMATPEGQGDCFAEGWAEATTLVMSCFEGEGEPQTYWALDVSTGDIEPTEALATPWTSVGANEPSVAQEYFVGDARWVGHYARDESERSQDYEPEFGVADDGQYRTVPVPYPGRGETPTVQALAKEGELVYLEGSFESADIGWLVALSVYDAETDTVTLLFPYPPGGPTSVPDVAMTGAPVGLTSWAVAR